MKTIGEIAKEALSLTAFLFGLGLVGMVLEDGLARWTSGANLIALIMAFAIFYAAIFAWCVWLYRSK